MYDYYTTLYYRQSSPDDECLDVYGLRIDVCLLVDTDPFRIRLCMGSVLSVHWVWYPRRSSRASRILQIQLRTLVHVVRSNRRYVSQSKFVFTEIFQCRCIGSYGLRRKVVGQYETLNLYKDFKIETYE